MKKIVGLCGYARTGKDTAAAGLGPLGWARFAFADALKEDLRAFVKWNYDIGIHGASEEQKRIIRPLLVAHGAGKRLQDPDHWVKRLFKGVDAVGKGVIVITDVRYSNEVDAILAREGKVIRIDRPGIGPANEEEGYSIGEIDLFWNFPRVVNDGTPAELAARVRSLVE